MRSQMKNERMNNEMGRERFGLIGHSRNNSLHHSVINQALLFHSYFIKVKHLVRGALLHIYTTREGRKGEGRKCVCTSSPGRVHTAG